MEERSLEQPGIDLDRKRLRAWRDPEPEAVPRLLRERGDERRDRAIQIHGLAPWNPLPQVRQEVPDTFLHTSPGVAGLADERGILPAGGQRLFQKREVSALDLQHRQELLGPLSGEERGPLQGGEPAQQRLRSRPTLGRERRGRRTSPALPRGDSGVRDRRLGGEGRRSESRGRVGEGAAYLVREGGREIPLLRGPAPRAPPFLEGDEAREIALLPHREDQHRADTFRGGPLVQDGRGTGGAVGVIYRDRRDPIEGEPETGRELLRKQAIFEERTLTAVETHQASHAAGPAIELPDPHARNPERPCGFPRQVTEQETRIRPRDRRSLRGRSDPPRAGRRPRRGPRIRGRPLEEPPTPQSLDEHGSRRKCPPARGEVRAHREWLQPSFGIRLPCQPDIICSGR